MKKVTLIFGIVIMSMITFAQKLDSVANFPSKYAELLVGKELKVLPTDVAINKIYLYGYFNFYKNDKFEYEDSYSSPNNYKSLFDKVFKVVSCEPYKNLKETSSECYSSTKFKLKIENSETGILYFDYNPKCEQRFPFKVIGGLTIPDGFYCENIETSYDKFTGDTTYKTKIAEEITFIKVKNGRKSTIYISANETGSTLNIGETGFYLLLKNGFKIEKPDAPIDVKSNDSGGWVYSAFVTLNENDIKLLTENAITDDRLYVYDGTIKYGKTLMEYLKCIVAK